MDKKMPTTNKKATPAMKPAGGMQAKPASSMATSAKPAHGNKK